MSIGHKNHEMHLLFKLSYIWPVDYQENH